MVYQWAQQIIDDFFKTLDDIKARVTALENAANTGNTAATDTTALEAKITDLETKVTALEAADTALVTKDAETCAKVRSSE